MTMALLIPYGTGELPERSRRKIAEFDPRSGVLFSIRETAELLSMSTQTIRRMIDDGRLQAFKIGDRFRIPSGSIGALMGMEGGDDENK